MLEIRFLTKKFGARTVLEDLSFSIAGGEVVGFLGPNGAGKTTTISIVSGVVEPTAGDVLINGMSILSNPVECKKITSVVPEEPWIWGRLSAREYLGFIGKIRGMDYAIFKERSDMLLEEFALADYADFLIESFSYGMRQKLVWCAALLSPPKLLLLDEPFTGLDPLSTRRARVFIEEMRVKHNTAVLVSTHNLDIASKICSRIIVVNQGRIIADEKKETIMERWRVKKDALPLDVNSDSPLEAAFLGIIKENQTGLE